MTHSTIRSIPEIFTDLIAQVTGLVRTESQLARAEISEKATRVLSGMAMVLVGMVLLIPALVILLQAAIAGLVENGMQASIAALIVGGAALVLGLILGLIGWSWAKPTSLVPDKTIDQLKRDAEVPRHSGITAHDGETGGTTNERMARQEAGYGEQRNHAA
jgi:uncharacterized membrane protein YqjE